MLPAELYQNLLRTNVSTGLKDPVKTRKSLIRLTMSSEYGDKESCREEVKVTLPRKHPSKLQKKRIAILCKDQK